MKTNSFVFLFVLLFLFLLLKHSSGSIFKEKLKDLMDISFECKEPICEENFNILEVVDCAVQEARWDYIVNKQSGKCNPKFPLEGACDVVFGVDCEETKLKNVFKLKKCFALFRRDVKMIKGTFVNNLIQGLVTVEYSDGSVETGYSGNGKFATLRRTFDRNGSFQNATCGSNAEYVLRRYHHGFILDVSPDEKILSPDGVNGIFFCKFSASGTFTDVCYDVDEDIVEANGCHVQIGAESDFSKLRPRDKSKLFKYNMRTNEMLYAHQDQHPLCEDTKDWSAEDIKENFLTWIKKISDPDRVFWLEPVNPEPLSPKRPVLDVKVLSLAGRTKMQTLSATVRSFQGKLLLHNVTVINGRLKAEIDENVAKLRDWFDPVTIEISSKDWHPLVKIIARLQSGKLHGLTLMHGAWPNDPNSLCAALPTENASFVGYFEAGTPVGFVWKGLLGEPLNRAWIFGEVDGEGEFTGDNSAYIYPDFRTAYRGKFKVSLMVAGREVEVMGIKCNTNGIKVLKFSDPSGPGFKYDPPNDVSLGDQPLITDALEQRYVEMRTSLEFPDAGDGLVAKIDIPEDTIVSLMSGLIFTTEQFVEERKKIEDWILENNFDFEDDEATFFWKYSIPVPFCDLFLDIPPEYRSASNFRATLGHKVNHSFEPNVQFVGIDSARFGPIVAVSSKRNIKKGEELFSNYGYKGPKPKWYSQLQKDFEAKKSCKV